jgi:serine/threonine protein kinase
VWMGGEFAMKTFYGPNNPDFDKEVLVLSGLCHPNIISLVCSRAEKRRCSIVMELMDGDLFSLMQSRLELMGSGGELLEAPFTVGSGDQVEAPFTVFEAVDIMLQVAEGMRYLHERRVVHRDLKSLNVLVKRVRTLDLEVGYVTAKVADFGLSKTKERSMTYSNQTPNMGTTRWMAPEMMMKHGDELVEVGVKYPYKCDVYSFAMVCYEILTGEVPFSSLGNPGDVKKLVLDGGRPELPRECPKELKRMIKSCWSWDPSHRPCFNDICANLRYLKFLLLCRASPF